MNRIFQVTWNSARQVWVVASELAQGDRPPRSQARVASSTLLMALVAALSPALAPQAHAQPLANELPTGGTVLMGNATSQLNGNHLLINQTSDRALTQWNSFNIGAAASVQINQPTALSSSVNRVLSNDPSRIFGSLTSNGQVVLINPAGVVFGPTARVDAGSIIASTLNLSNDDFAQGKLNFSNNASTAGTVSNQGLLKAGQGGYVALIGPRLENTGTLQANQGQVLLGAGERVTLGRGQDGLINMSVDAGALDAQIRLGGVLQANDGSAVVTARAEGALSKSAINMSGLMEAKGLTAQGGKIILDSGVNGTTEVTGVLNASSEAGKGGAVHLLGEQVGLFGQARINASGATGGGEVLVGGDMLGQGGIPASKATVLDAGAVIHADAGLSGKGGKVVLWSDEYTGMYGQISAKGGQASGDGGFVETSSKDNLQAYGSVDTSARNGRAGEWLLDPRNVTIVNPGTDSIASSGGSYTSASDSATISATSINTALNNGNNVTIATGSSGTQLGDITVTSAISKTAGGSATLTLQAHNSIYINNTISSTSNALNMTFSAANKVAATTGGVKVNSNLTSNGGQILIGGATGAMNQGIGYALNADSSSAAVTIGTGVSILSAGGKIVLNGHSTLPGSGNYSGVEGGIYVRSGATLDSGGGNIALSGIASGYAKTFGFGMEAASGTTTTVRTGATTGSIMVDAQNLLDVNGALGLTNGGSQARIQFIAPSVAHMLFKLNGWAQLTTFTIKPPCESSFPNCGTLVVPGSNGSYLYAGYQAVSMPTESVYVMTGDASRAYNQGNAATGLNVTTMGAPGDFNTAALSFTTSSKNAGTYYGLNSAASNPNTFVSNNGKTYAVAYYHGSYQINPIAVTASASNKQYDGTLAANLTLNGILAGDAVTASSSSINFASKNVGTGILVSGTGMSLSGADAGNYSLSGSTITAFADITQRVVNLSGSRVYDGTVDVDSGILTLDNLAAGEQLVLTGVGQMSNKTAGTGKSFQVNTLSLGNGLNGDASNYTLVGGSRSVNISKADLALSGLSAADKVYDGTRSAVLTGVASVTALGSDVVSLSGTATGEFADKNAGTGKAVTVTGLSLGGADADNYNIVAPGSLTANISKADLAVTGVSANNKTYNGTVAATLSGTATVAAFGGDVVSVAGTATAAFADKNVGNNKAVTVTGYSLTGTDAGNYNIVAPGGLTANISKADLAVLGLTAYDKTYDATDAATLAGTATVSAFGSDVVLLTGTGSATFSDKNVGTNKALTVTGYSLTGMDAGNYNIVAPASLTASISKANLSVSGVSANNKTYDGTTAATLSGTATVSALAGDVVSVTGTGTASFNNKNVGNGKAVTVTGYSLTGADAGNYNIVAPAGLTANISKADLVVTGVSANNKTYDSTVAATLSGTAAVAAFGSDVVSVAGAGVATFNNKNAGNGKAVTVTGYTLTGTDAGNYNIVAPSGLTANISKADLAVSGLVASNKTYDANRNANLSGTASVTAIGSDVVSVTGTASGLFDNKNAGNNKAVSVTGLTLTGADAGNYNLVAPGSLTANISKASLLIGGLQGQNKTFDGNTTVGIAGAMLAVGVLPTDQVGMAGSIQQGTVPDSSVGQGKPVSVNLGQISLTGPDAGNYQLVGLSGPLTADITQAAVTELPLPAPNILVVSPPKLPDALVPTQASGSQPTQVANAPTFQVAAASPEVKFESLTAEPSRTGLPDSGMNGQNVVLKTARQTDSIAVSQTPAGALVLSMNRALPIESNPLQALPVFSQDSSGMKLDFRLKVEARGQDLTVERVSTGDIPVQPDLNRRGSESLNLKIQSASETTAEFVISTVDSALMIVPVNQAGVELLTSNPNLVIGTSIIQGKTEQPESFDQIKSVVLPMKK